jgi:hypothetical protein
MSEIDLFESRIKSALDRLLITVENQRAQTGALTTLEADTIALRAELDAARQAETSVRQDCERFQNAIEIQNANHAKTIAERDAKIAEVTATNLQLTAAADNLRAEVEEGSADAASINRTLEIELRSLRSSRGKQLEEMNAVLAELEPLIQKEVPNA